MAQVNKTKKIQNLSCCLHWFIQAWNQWKEGKTNDLVDSNVVESCIPDEALLCVQLGLLCVQDNPNDRPPMSSIVFILEHGSATLPIPNQPELGPPLVLWECASSIAAEPTIPLSWVRPPVEHLVGNRQVMSVASNDVDAVAAVRRVVVLPLPSCRPRLSSTWTWRSHQRKA